jgi:hypothetical protein
MKPISYRHRCRTLRIVLLVLAFFAPPTLGGIATIYFRLQGTDALDAATTDMPPPAPRPPTAAQRAVIVVARRSPTACRSWSCSNHTMPFAHAVRTNASQACRS